MERYKKHILTVLLLLFLSSMASAQSRQIKALKRQRQKIQEQINLTDKELRSTKKSKITTVKKLNIIKKNLIERQNLIANFSQQITALQSEITVLEKEKNVLEKKLQKRQKDYVKLVQSTQTKNDLYSKLHFLLSAQSFNKAWRRMRYLQQFSNYRIKQLEEIKALKKEVEDKKQKLVAHQKDKKQLLASKESEKQKLKLIQEKEKNVLDELKNKEKQLAKDFQNHIRKRDKIDKRIENVIREQIRKEREKRKRELAQTSKRTNRGSNNKNKIQETNQREKPIDTDIYQSKAGRRLSQNFANNCGRLPWPVSQGKISGHFGRHSHPKFRHVTVNNKGVYFKTPKSTNARAVFGGVVTQIFSLPGGGNAVIVQHGNYRTVYGNLTTIFVQQGQRVKAKQSIGKIYTDDQTGKTELQFQIWKGTSLQNPERWLTR